MAMKIIKIIIFFQKIIRVVSLPYYISIVFTMALIAVFNLIRSGSVKTNEVGHVYADNKKDIKELICEYIEIWNKQVESNRWYYFLQWAIYFIIIWTFWFFTFCFIYSLIISSYE